MSEVTNPKEQQIITAAANGWEFTKNRRFSGGQPVEQVLARGTQTLTIRWSATATPSTAATESGKLARKGLTENIVAHLAS